MVVLETADAWQLIEQVDHATLSGQLAAAWGAGPFAPAHPALVLASFRHDEGWAVWDRHPLLTGTGEPMSFLQAPVRWLLSSYEACVDAIAYEDTHAGLLVSRHVSGLRRGRYGLAPDSAARAAFVLNPDEDPPIGRFVAAEERRQADLRDRLDLIPGQERHEYAQLQLFDVLSLKLCLTDLDRAGQAQELALAPTALGSPEAPLTIETLGSGRVAVEPWPFAVARLELTVPRRTLRAGRFAHVQELREAWARTEPAPLRIELTVRSDSASDASARTSGASANSSGQTKR